MAGYDVVWIPFAVMYVLMMIQPTLLEVQAYYSRGGLARNEDDRFDDTCQSMKMWGFDAEVYYKRFLDRPISEAAKAYYAFLDWSAEPYDRTIYCLRRNYAKRDREVSRLRPYICGPFVFNWPKKQWLRGDDAAGMLQPAWGVGGEARARAEFAAADAKGYKKHYHYQIMRRIRAEQAAKARTAAAVTTTPGSATSS